MKIITFIILCSCFYCSANKKIENVKDSPFYGLWNHDYNIPETEKAIPTTKAKGGKK